MLAVMLVVRVVGVSTNIPRLSQANYSLLAPARAGPGPSMRGSRAWRRQTQAETPVCHNKVLLSDDNMVM